VSKTCPSCGYKPIGPFTDNCPICAEPVRNVRSDGAASSMGFSTPWLRYGLVAGLLSIAGCCGIGVWRLGSGIQDMQQIMQDAIAKQEAERQARTVVVTAADLLHDFQNDADAADQKYRGKYLELTGVLERRGKGGGAPFVILHGGDADAAIKIECFLAFVDVDEQPPAKQDDIGRQITVRGEYSGRVTNVQVRGCVLVK
jgi:putative nucleic acid binding protein